MNDENDIEAAYDRAADVYRDRYSSEPRKHDIDITMQYLAGIDNPRIVEVGCAYGREAKYLVNFTKYYYGIDISSRFIAMAQEQVPSAAFQHTDVMNFAWPVNIHAVFAFASLLHLSKTEVAMVLERIAQALRPDGVVFLSLKWRETYQTGVETDDVVARRFWYYNQDTIAQITPSELTEVCYDEQVREERWFTMILQKRPKSG